jgi:hypothetical protein
LVAAVLLVIIEKLESLLEFSPISEWWYQANIKASSEY